MLIYLPRAIYSQGVKRHGSREEKCGPHATHMPRNRYVRVLGCEDLGAAR